jgi:hypothetical protein
MREYIGGCPDDGNDSQDEDQDGRYNKGIRPA